MMGGEEVNARRVNNSREILEQKEKMRLYLKNIPSLEQPLSGDEPFDNLVEGMNRPSAPR